MVLLSSTGKHCEALQIIHDRWEGHREVVLEDQWLQKSATVKEIGS